MFSPIFKPAEFSGLKFDRGMQLFEFDTIRRNESLTIDDWDGSYKNSGAYSHLVETYIRSRIEVVEIPTPMMLMPGGEVRRDACITNYFESSAPDFFIREVGRTMAKKLMGMEYSDIAPGYYRAAWCPPPEIRSGLRPVKFHYPKAGYMGVIADTFGITPGTKFDGVETAPVNIAFVTGIPSINASVLFVIADSPIYRITNQDGCLGRFYRTSRMVVEFRGECDVIYELYRLGYCYNPILVGQISANIPKPTVSNVEKHPELFCNSMNDQILRGLKNAKANA